MMPNDAAPSPSRNPLHHGRTHFHHAPKCTPCRSLHPRPDIVGTADADGRALLQQRERLIRFVQRTRDHDRLCGRFQGSREATGWAERGGGG